MKPSVGIHEDVVLKNVTIDKNGKLVLFIRSKEEAKPEEEVNPFDQMNASEVIEESGDGGITFWPFKTPELKDKKTNQDRTEKELGEFSNRDIQTMKNQFQQILEQFMVKDDIKWSIFDGTGMDKETYWQQIYNQPILDVIYKNLCEQFMGMIAPYLDKNEHAVRFKLVRQSKEKHFSRVPGMFIKDNPFIEPMSVPQKDSRVKWTKYELAEGLNDGTPVSRDTADTTEDVPEADENAFGSR